MHLPALCSLISRVVPMIAVLTLTACAPAKKKRAPDAFSVQSFGAMWDDPSRCLSAVELGRRVPRGDDRFRVGTWNIRWFPDGTHYERRDGTDLEWLACLIAYLNVDVLGVQEFKATAKALSALNSLTAKLHALTGSAWGWQLDDCDDESRQHVGILYRKDRVELTHVVTHGVIDPTAGRRGTGTASCPGYLRPALGAYVRSKAGGVSFHFAVIHLDSGRKSRDFANRQEAWQRLTALAAERFALAEDGDFIVAGDFNMMGCKECGGFATGQEERAEMVRVLQELSPAFKVPAPSAACSQYYKGQGALLDQIIYTSLMQEASGATMLVSGICGASKCRDVASDQLPAFRYLSDHCPIVMDIVDKDLDAQQ